MNPRLTPSELTEPDVVPKLCGADVELGNFITGIPSIRYASSADSTAGDAARALLHQFSGFSRRAFSTSASTESSYGTGRGAYDDDDRKDDRRYRQHDQDWGRRYLPANGGCVYIDLNHLEICTPECVSAFDHVAAFHAMLRLTRKALRRANAVLPPGLKIRVLVNNTDGANSWGGHLNLLITRRAYENIFDRKMHYLLFLAAYQISSIILTGAGAVGSSNGRPATDFRISSRGDFYEVLTGAQTTFNRPLVNSRDEGLVGSRYGEGNGRNRLARLHIIFFDTTLCPVATLLKVGMTQIILAMIEQDHVPVQLILDDPLAALLAWSHDPELSTTSPLLAGAHYTALEHAQAVFDAARQFVEAGRAEGLVPRVGEVVTLWGQTLEQLRQRDWPALAGRCDWVAKRQLLQRVIGERNLGWNSPQVKVLDQLYHSLDDDGLFWTLSQAGAVQQVISEEQIDHLTHEPPEDTRAWLRAQILRHASELALEDVDWDRIELRIEDLVEGYWITPRYLSLEMGNPLRFNRAECEPILRQATSLLEGLRALGLRRQNAWTNSSMPAAGNYSTELVVRTGERSQD
jgi:Pup amidohydrolase